MRHCLRRIHEDNMVTKEEVRHLAFNKPMTFDQIRVQEFIRTPIDRFYTTRGIPGIGDMLADHLKTKFGVTNPRGFVDMLRFKTRNLPRRLPVHVRASIVANFLDEAWFTKNGGRGKIEAAISIALSEWKWVSSRGFKL